MIGLMMITMIEVIDHKASPSSFRLALLVSLFLPGVDTEDPLNSSASFSRSLLMSPRGLSTKLRSCCVLMA